MKLTKDGLENGGVFYDVEDLENIFQNYPTWKKKARSYDNLLDNTDRKVYEKFEQNQKLRELIEDDLKNCDWSDGEKWNFHLNRLQHLLRRAKNEKNL